MFPPILGVVADHKNTQTALVIPLIGFIISWSFPLYLNLFKAKELDGYLVSEVGIAPTAVGTVEEVGAGSKATTSHFDKGSTV